MKTTSYIVAAGKQSRFKSDTPKGLMIYKDNKTVLDINLENSLKFSDNVVIVTSYDNYDIYNDYVSTHGYDLSRVSVVKIKENHGSGHTIMQAIAEEDGNVFIMWGDSIQQDPELFQTCINGFNGYLVVPCRFEENPYTHVSISVDFDAVDCKFKKFNEVKRNFGYHDLSLFYGDVEFVRNALRLLAHDSNRISMHGNEMEFLDVINVVKNIKIIPYDSTAIKSFNTIEEFEALK